MGRGAADTCLARRSPTTAGGVARVHNIRSPCRRSVRARQCFKSTLRSPRTYESTGRRTIFAHRRAWMTEYSLTAGRVSNERSWQLGSARARTRYGDWACAPVGRARRSDKDHQRCAGPGAPPRQCGCPGAPPRQCGCPGLPREPRTRDGTIGRGSGDGERARATCGLPGEDRCSICICTASQRIARRQRDCFPNRVVGAG